MLYPKEIGDPERMRELLDGMITSARRCSGIVDSLVRCVRAQSAVMAPHDVNESLGEVLELLEPWAEHRGVQLRLERAERLPPVLGAADDLRLAFFNLGTNAIQSCDRGGEVLLRSEALRSSVRISVQDDGRGMTEGEQAHAFDPFYSRRGGHEGTGLGLTLCHGIVTDHGGTIEIHSQPGLGTRVTIELPAVREPD